MDSTTAGIVGGIVGSFIGGILSFWGSVQATKSGIKSQNKMNELYEKELVISAAKSLLIKIDLLTEVINNLIYGKENIPKGYPTPIIEQRLIHFEWYEDLARVSDYLDEDEYRAILNFFAGVERSNDLMRNIWEMRASNIDYEMQLQSFWLTLKPLTEVENMRKALKRCKSLQ